MGAPLRHVSGNRRSITLLSSLLAHTGLVWEVVERLPRPESGGRKPLPHYNDSAETRTTASWLVKDFFGYWFECPGGARNTAHHDSVKLGAPGARLVKNALQCCICFALTENLVHDACEWRRGVDDDPVVRKGCFRVIHATVISRSSAVPPQSVGSSATRLSNPPETGVQVDRKDKHAVK